MAHNEQDICQNHCSSHLESKSEAATKGFDDQYVTMKQTENMK